MLKLLEKIIKKDSFKAILQGNGSEQTFSEALHHFQNLQLERQKELSEKAYSKLTKKNSKQCILSTLILCDFISTTNPEFCSIFPTELLITTKQKSRIHNHPKVKQEKQELSYNNFIYFYLQFLQFKIWSQVQYEGINSIVPGLEYFQNALESIRLCLNYDFVIHFCLSKFQATKIFKIAIQNVLRRICQDLQLMIDFVNKWSHVILQSSKNSFRMNKVYEQLIYICKNMEKLEWIRKKVNLDLNFPIYKIDKELNKNIEKKMKERHEEKLVFLSERNEKPSKLQSSSKLIQTNKIKIKSKSSSIQEQDQTEAQIYINAKKMF